LTLLVDANLLIYAYNSSAQQHRAARDWLDGQLTGAMPVGLPWSSLLAFLRVMTHPRLLARPVMTLDGWEQVSRWLSSPVVWVPQPTERHAEVLGQLLALPGVRGNLVHDADFAALAIEHGLILCSTDGDFARFPGLGWQNPLAG
jgi:toxin-antitoxin system PIN domain toxin